MSRCPVRRGGDLDAVAVVVGEEQRQLLPLLGHGSAVGLGETAQRVDDDGADLDDPGGGHPAVDQDDALAGDRQAVVGVVDVAAAVVVAEDRVVERGQELHRGG